jgi:hypothetical protein
MPETGKRMRACSYNRVLPRDLFNEAKLLKCLGRLSLMVHEGLAGPLKVQHKHSNRSFRVGQDQSDGSIRCTNVLFYVRREGNFAFVTLYSPLNSRLEYPLMFLDERPGGEDGRVFAADGKLTPEFRALIQHLTERPF